MESIHFQETLSDHKGLGFMSIPHAPRAPYAFVSAPHAMTIAMLPCLAPPPVSSE